MKLGLTVLRAVLGLVFIGHGTQKLFGWFQGEGLRGTGRKVHAGKGPWFVGGGWEYNVVLIATLFAISDVGPGDWSLDRALGSEHAGPLWATTAVGVGALAPTLATPALFMIAGGGGMPV